MLFNKSVIETILNGTSNLFDCTKKFDKHGERTNTNTVKKKPVIMLKLKDVEKKPFSTFFLCITAEPIPALLTSLTTTMTAVIIANRPNVSRERRRDIIAKLAKLRIPETTVIIVCDPSPLYTFEVLETGIQLSI